MQRKLTKRFTTYSVNQFEKARKCAIVDALDVGNLEVNKITALIQVGNGKDFTEEQACEKLDEYLDADDDRSIISAYIDLLEELDRDLRVLKACGIKIDDLRKQFEDEIKNRTDPKNLPSNEETAGDDVVEE